MAKKKTSGRKVKAAARQKRQPARKQKKAQRRPAYLKSAAETFELPVSAFSKEKPKGEAAALDHPNSAPLDVHPIPKDGKKAAQENGMPHLATSVLAAGTIAVLTFIFFQFFMKYEFLYAFAVSVPVFAAFAIAINSMLEERSS
ncbi:MAG: hypothetical protein WCT52_00015 [Candidatus Micrarchaeia archaeon]